MQDKRLLLIGVLVCCCCWSCLGITTSLEGEGQLANERGRQEASLPERTNDGGVRDTPTQDRATRDLSAQDTLAREEAPAEQGVQDRHDPDMAPGEPAAREPDPPADRAPTDQAPVDRAPVDRGTPEQVAEQAKEAPAPDAVPKTLSARYPNDTGIAKDPSVLFHDDFEQGWGKWNAPKADTTYLHIENTSGLAYGGQRFLRSTVTKAHLDAKQYISSSTRYTFARRVDQLYWRFYARFKGVAPNPHHWVRVSAGDENYQSSGLANTVPPGDKGFWFDFDVNNNDVFNFYVYWYKMRSGRCNDGSATPGCAGDQGRTYYYGNVFRPPNQTPYTKDKWFCIEMMAKTNTVGKSDGELAFWIDDRLIDEYKPGHPVGTWLRATFHTGGCNFSACTTPKPFAGFDFRTNSAVRFKQIFLDAYYERGSTASKKAALEKKGLTVSDEMTIYYDDVVAATQRIGCKVKR